jgi:DNA polymerase-1
MEKNGVEIDTRFLDKLAKKIQKQLAKLEEQIHSQANGQFNINSPKQLQDVLYNKLDIPTKGIKKTPQGELSTAASELEKIDHPIAKLLLEYRELEKMRSTYVEALPKQVDNKNRVHTSYNQAVTATGRLSSSDPNLQNIPARTEFGRQVRNAFVAPHKHVLLAADYSQVELRVLAHLCGDPALTKVYRERRGVQRNLLRFIKFTQALMS